MKKLFALLVVAGMCFACTPKPAPEVEAEAEDIEVVGETNVDENTEMEETAEVIAE
jgi:uncharacterized protein YggE